MVESNGENRLKESFHVSEILFATAGFLILLSALVVYHTGDFTWWNLAKIFYLFGVIVFIKYS